MKSKIKKELIREIEEIAIFLHSSSIKGKNGRFWHRYNDSNRIDDSEKNEFIYGGNAGICLFFIELYQFDAKKEYLEIIEESVKWLYNRTKKESTTNYAFLTGRVGTAYVFALCGKLLNNEKYTKHSLDISHAAICDFSNPIKKHDFLGGLAGTLIGLIQIHDIIPESDILEGIKMGAVKLIEDLSINKTGIFWGWKPQSMAPLCGLSHGNAGYGFVFHELSKLFNDDNLLVIASICFDYENRHFNKEINNWPDYRLKKEVDDNYKFPSLSDKKVIDCVSWCHGAPGIGLLRQSVLGNGRGVITDEKLKINNALKKTVLPKGNRMARPSLGLCHGIAGNAFVFLNQRKKRYGRYKMVPEEFARYILFSKSINKGYYTTFTHIDKRVDPSLFLGLSGIGYFFLFMLNEKESSILLPKINLKSNKTEINFMEIFLKAIAKNMHPENFDKISAESFNILSKTFFNLFKEGRIKNEIEFLRIQIEELIMLSKDIVTETFFRHEKFRLRLALDNVFYMEGQYFGSVELVGNIMPSGNYEIKKILKDNNFILCNNVEFKRFNGQTGTKYYLYINHFSNVESIEINQFQFLLINEFSILTTFEDAFIRIGEYIDLKQDSEQIRRLILDQFLFLYQKNVVKSSPKKHMIVFISLSKKNEEVTKVRSALSDYEINPKYVFESLESVASENEIQDLFFKTKILFVHADFLSKREYDFIEEFHSAKKILFLGMINEMVFSIPNLYRVFTNNFQDVPLSHKPIFFEYLTFPAIEQLTITKTKNAKILSNNISIGYIPSNSFYSLIQIIRFFNLHPKFRFNIYLNHSDYESLLKNISNENILFSDYCVDNLIKGNHDIFISSGPGISDLLFLERPILIVGSKGYGGLLSMKNFIQHIDCDFSGRIGGDENEPIPEQLLIKDIGECLKLYDEAPATGYSLFKYCLPIVKNKLAIKLRPIEVLVATRIYNNFTSAVPFMDKAVKLVKLGSKGDEYALLNGFNKIVLKLNNEDIKCLRYINGKNSFDDICTMTGVSDKSQIYHFLDKLIDYKLADFV